MVFFRKPSSDRSLMELPDMPKQEEDSSLITFSGDIEEPKKNKKKGQWL